MAASKSRSTWSLSSLSTIYFIGLLAAFISWTPTSGGKVSTLENTDVDPSSDFNSIVVIGITAAACLVLIILLIAQCTDCYKSEVSSDFHPATGNSGVRWGGAGSDYTTARSSDVNDRVLGAGFTGDAVLPGDGGQQALPYTMIPSHVPEAQGFRGYGNAVMGDAGMRGYSAVGSVCQGPVRVGSHHLPGAHASPLTEPEEPPPSYFASTNP